MRPIVFVLVVIAHDRAAEEWTERTKVNRQREEKKMRYSVSLVISTSEPGVARGIVGGRAFWAAFKEVTGFLPDPYRGFDFQLRTLFPHMLAERLAAHIGKVAVIIPHGIEYTDQAKISMEVIAEDGALVGLRPSDIELLIGQEAPGAMRASICTNGARDDEWSRLFFSIKVNMADVVGLKPKKEASEGRIIRNSMWRTREAAFLGMFLVISALLAPAFVSGVKGALVASNSDEAGRLVAEARAGRQEILTDLTTHAKSIKEQISASAKQTEDHYATLIAAVLKGAPPRPESPKAGGEAAMCCDELSRTVPVAVTVPMAQCCSRSCPVAPSTVAYVQKKCP
jgi:hypothetical protein